MNKIISAILSLFLTSAAYAQGEEVEAAAVRPKAGIAVSALDNLPAGAVGVLNEHNGGLGHNLWAGYTPNEVLHAIEKLPARTTSATARALQERLLLSIATLPANLAPQHGPMILNARLDKLMQMEAYEALGRLLDVVPAPARDESWYKYKLSQHFLTHDFDGGCKLVMAGVAKFPNQYWQEKILFCLGYQKEFEKAATTVELMGERNLAPPDWLRSLLLVWAGKEPLPPVENILRALPVIDAAMLGTGDGDLLPEHMPNVAAGYYKLQSGMTAIDEARQQAAMEMAVKFNRINIDSLIKKYEVAEGANASGNAKQYFELHQQFSIEDNMKKLTEIWQQYDKRGDALLAARLYEKDFVELSRAIFRKNMTTEFAPAAFAALFAQNKMAEAAMWQEAAGMENKTAWPALLALFEPLEGKPERADIAALVAQFNQMADDSFTATAKAVFEGFGLLPVVSQTPPVQKLLKLQHAATAGRHGEIIISCLEYIGADAGNMPLEAIAPVLSALRSIGLGKEALALAHEIITGTLINDGAD